MTSKPTKFECGKCGIEPTEWERTPNAELSDYKCPRCGKSHFHLNTEITSELVPIDEKDREAQNVFVTVTGRKIRGKENAKNYLDVSEDKRCRNCGKKKSENWKYSSNDKYDLICPECEQKHLEDTTCLIPVSENGKRQDVVTDSKGNSYIGDEEIKERINSGIRNAETSK